MKASPVRSVLLSGAASSLGSSEVLGSGLADPAGTRICLRGSEQAGEGNC